MKTPTDVVNDIQQTIKSSKVVPWFPSLTTKLVSRAEIDLLWPKGLSLKTYSTEPYLRGATSTSDDSVQEVSVGNDKRIKVEELFFEARKFYENLGLRFCSSDDLREHNLTIIARSFKLLCVVPSLLNSVIEIVRSMIILESCGPQFDVSYSDPNIPFTIFFSIPPIDSENAEIRLMESIVHEAMHLQLTFIESSLDLVSPSNKLMQSPWRPDPRPPQGVLHGAYVFCVIACTFDRLRRARKLSSAQRGFLAHRLKDISVELKTALESLSPDLLTENGRALVTLLQQKTASAVFDF